MACTSGRVVPQVRSVLEAAGRSIVVGTKRFVGHHHGIEITSSFNAVDKTVIDHALRPRRDNWKIGRLLAEELFERGNLDLMIGSSNRGSTASAAV